MVGGTHTALFQEYQLKAGLVLYKRSLNNPNCHVSGKTVKPNQAKVHGCDLHPKDCSPSRLLSDAKYPLRPPQGHWFVGLPPRRIYLLSFLGVHEIIDFRLQLQTLSLVHFDLAHMLQRQVEQHSMLLHSRTARHNRT